MPARKKPAVRSTKRVAAVTPAKTATSTRTYTFTITNTALAIALACLGTASIAAAGMGTINTCATESSVKMIGIGPTTLCKKQTLKLETNVLSPQPIFQASSFSGTALALLSNGNPAKKFINKGQTAEFTYPNGAAMVTYLGLDDQSRAVIKVSVVPTVSAPAPAISPIAATSTVTPGPAQGIPPTSTPVLAPTSTPAPVLAPAPTGTPSLQPVAPLVAAGPVTKACVDPDTTFDPYLNFYPGKASIDVLKPESLKVKSAIQIKMSAYNAKKINIFTDNCSPDDLSKVNEALCIDKEKVGMYTFDCPSGTMCNDGSCK